MLKNITDLEHSEQIRFGDPLISTNDLFYSTRKINLNDTYITKKFLLDGASAADYLYFIEKNTPSELISYQNFYRLKTFANIFPKGLTSFLILESELDNQNANSDFCFAISSKNREREILLDFLNKEKSKDIFLNKDEWLQIKNFTNNWANPNSILYENIKGMWFEFDIVTQNSNIVIPSIFIHTKPIYSESNFNWLLNPALSILNGIQLSNRINKQLKKCIQNIPKEASILQTGIMFSRNLNEFRIVLNGIKPNKIIPYLKKIGYNHDTNELKILIQEVNSYVNRIVLHISIGYNVNSKIGIECSFLPDLYNQEKRWGKFLQYLNEKKLCIPDKCSAVLSFPGITNNNIDKNFNPNNLKPRVIVNNKNSSTKLVRYISHIKIQFQPGFPLKTKIYSGIRLFGYLEDKEKLKNHK